MVHFMTMIIATHPIFHCMGDLSTLHCIIEGSDLNPEYVSVDAKNCLSDLTFLLQIIHTL
jgi:hypothetical protein